MNAEKAFTSLHLRIFSVEFQWDIMSGGGAAQSIANLAKGQDRGNSVNIQVRFSTVSLSASSSRLVILSDSMSATWSLNYRLSLQAMKSKDNSMWLLQDGCTNSYESMVVYAPVDITGMQAVMTGCDSSNIAILPSGFSILPDGLESRPLVITSRQEEKSSECGSLLTIAFQVLTNPSPTAKLTMESMESVNTLISCTLRNIKTSLQCEDG